MRLADTKKMLVLSLQASYKGFWIIFVHFFCEKMVPSLTTELGRLLVDILKMKILLLHYRAASSSNLSLVNKKSFKATRDCHSFKQDLFRSITCKFISCELLWLEKIVHYRLLDCDSYLKWHSKGQQVLWVVFGHFMKCSEAWQRGELHGHFTSGRRVDGKFSMIQPLLNHFFSNSQRAVPQCGSPIHLYMLHLINSNYGAETSLIDSVYWLEIFPYFLT